MQEALGRLLEGHTHAVVPGFYGCDTHGNVKTFSRGGSDITGAIVARAVNAGTCMKTGTCMFPAA